MKRIERWILKLLGGTAATIGAILVSWESVTLYYLLTLRIQAGEEHPPFLVAAALLAFGMLFLVMGYWVQRRTVSQPRTDNADR
jgi:ABC-type branched-subunit amino acid transport system permease subunit